MKQHVLKVTIYKHATGWRWRMQAANSRIIAASTESYLERRKAIANINAVTGLGIVGRGNGRVTVQYFSVPPRVRV